MPAILEKTGHPVVRLCLSAQPGLLNLLQQGTVRLPRVSPVRLFNALNTLADRVARAIGKLQSAAAILLRFARN
jgi:hypothetical protein